MTAELVNEIILIITQLFKAEGSVVFIVVSIIVLMLLWKLTKYIFTKMLKREMCLAEYKAIAVAYKALHEQIDPEHAKKLIEDSMKNCTGEG